MARSRASLSKQNIRRTRFGVSSNHHSSPCQSCFKCANSVLPGVPLLEPVEQGVFVEGGRCRHVAAGQLDVGNGVCRRDDLDEPRPVACRQATVWYDSVSRVEKWKEMKGKVTSVGKLGAPMK